LLMAVQLAQSLRQEPAQETEEQLATCPHCQHTGPVQDDFGYRVIRGASVRQSWCRACRASPDSHPSRR
jgi:hypothetical protein